MSELSPEQRLYDLMRGTLATRALGLAADLDVAHALSSGPRPVAELPSFACALEESLAAPLRAGEPPVVGIVRDGKLLLDCRTLADGEIDEVAAAVAATRE